MADRSTHNHIGGQKPVNQPSGTDSTVVCDGRCRVGVLSTHNSKETKAILNAISALGHQPVWLRNENFCSHIDGDSVSLSPEVDVLINRLLLTKSDHPLEDLQFAGILADNVPTLNHPSQVGVAIHKFRAGLKLAAAGLPVPDAYYARSLQEIKKWEEKLPTPAAHKRTVGTNGRAMDRVDAGEAVSPNIRNKQSFLQEFLETDEERPSDVRVYVVDGQVVGAMRRRAPEGEWRTNVALGGETDDLTGDIDDATERLALAATNVLGLDMAGVDLMSDEGEWKVLEVNATAGFKGLYEVTGESPAPYIAQAALSRAGEDVPDAQVTTLANELDDSVPECKPDINPSDSENIVLGYTTRVQITGTAQTEAAIAKADTGAKRTSIDTELAGRIGAGPIVGTAQVQQSARAESQTRPLVDIDLRVGSSWQTVTASVADREDMTYPVLLGRDILRQYKLDISQRVEE